MTFKRLSANKLALSLAVTSALSSSFVTANAAEQDTQAQENIEVISVTGTRRSLRSIAESSVPVDIITSSDMASTGQLEISQVLANQVPSFNFQAPTFRCSTEQYYRRTQNPLYVTSSVVRTYGRDPYRYRP
eukprot:TRINITY_DN28731_c0_g1_i1.p1 TRINITY_DN28731_c0_g1~~TRINITY_DN28731_c0_g1_i1.p1  ORF type:complete len:132 (-),score=2.98 TRINITY_DN28731_c0_g1_i1:55-450(-)